MDLAAAGSTQPRSDVSARRRRGSRAIGVAASVAGLTGGLALCHLVEPSVTVESITVGGRTPALHFVPASPGRHPVALLAHGVTASKETLFRLGEALAAAGFDAYAVDLPGHGASPRPFAVGENAATLSEAAKVVGPVDVFVGHSMGAYAGAGAMREGGLAPRLFVALGAVPDLPSKDTRLLLLAGRFEEAVSIARLEEHARAYGATLVLSSQSDHALEPYDPWLVNAAAGSAAEVMGSVAPPAPTRFRWRLLGGLVALAGALTLGRTTMLLVPARLNARGVVLAAVVIAAAALALPTWAGATPVLRRLPAEVVAILGAALVLTGMRRVGVPRWSLAAAGALITLGCAGAGAHFFALVAGLGTLLLVAGAALGWLTARSSTPREGDWAFALFVGYAVGQWAPVLL